MNDNKTTWEVIDCMEDEDVRICTDNRNIIIAGSEWRLIFKNCTTVDIIVISDIGSSEKYSTKHFINEIIRLGFIRECNSFGSVPKQIPEFWKIFPLKCRNCKNKSTTYSLDIKNHNLSEFEIHCDNCLELVDVLRKNFCNKCNNFQLIINRESSKLKEYNIDNKCTVCAPVLQYKYF